MELQKKPHIKSVYSVAVPSDAKVMIDANDFEQASNVVAEEIHSLIGILRTTTLLAFE